MLPTGSQDRGPRFTEANTVQRIAAHIGTSTPDKPVLGRGLRFVIPDQVLDRRLRRLPGRLIIRSLSRPVER